MTDLELEILAHVFARQGAKGEHIITGPKCLATPTSIRKAVCNAGADKATYRLWIMGYLTNPLNTIPRGPARYMLTTKGRDALKARVAA